MTPTHFTDDLSVHSGRLWVHMHKGFTHPAYRGRRLHAIGMTLALASYRTRGFRGLVSIVSANNTVSLASCARMRYRRFGSIYTLRPGRLFGRGQTGRIFVFATSGCKALGFRLDRSTVDTPPLGIPAPVRAASAAHIAPIS